MNQRISKIVHALNSVHYPSYGNQNNFTHESDTVEHNVFQSEYYSKPKEWHDTLDLFIRKLDDEIRIDKHRFRAIYDGTSRIAKLVCKRLAKKSRKFAGITLESTGSLASGVKVGLPHEEDFLLQLDLSKCGCFCLSSSGQLTEEFTAKLMEKFQKYVHEIIDGQVIDMGPHWKIYEAQNHKAGVCLVMEYRENVHLLQPGVGVTIDLVPIIRVTQSEASTFRNTMRQEAREYLHSKHLDTQLDIDLIRLLGRNELDTGTIENNILASLDEPTKRAFRVTNFLIQNFVADGEYIHQYPTISIDPYHSYQLYGLAPV